MTSDWVVELVLGPRWLGVSPIFALLGIVGIIQPVASTTGWLFITQGRPDDMFRWALVGGTLTIAAICAGLPWGATGVAASYSLVSLVIVTPALWWFTGRKGPVRTLDFYRTVALPTAAVITVTLALLVFRQSVTIHGSFLKLLAAVPSPVLCRFRLRATSRGGREALLETRRSRSC
jgi:PST family polysaccharide transporter